MELDTPGALLLSPQITSTRMKLSEYILQPRAVRVAHIDLSAPCTFQKEVGVPDKQSLLNFLGVQGDIPNWRDASIHRCHLCECDSSHGNCRNPRHIYLGTASENFNDFLEANPDHLLANGSGPYRSPETGECRKMSRGEAEELGWVGVNAGKGTYRNPETGETKTMTKDEALSSGWVGVTSGKSTYRNPETGECRSMSSEEAEIAGWVHANAGKALYVNPETGEQRAMTKEEAERDGWIYWCVGLGAYKNPETGECRMMTKEEAQRAGWVGVGTGLGTYRDPKTGKCRKMTREEANEMGWVGVRANTKQRTVVCPHCGKEGSVPNMNRYHFDNCDQQEGSWRWFKAQLKQWSKEQRAA